MEKIIGTLFMITLLLITFSSSYYVDALASYDTKASITFIEPEGDEFEPGDIPSGLVVDDSLKNKSILPQTATNVYNIMLIGLSILIIGSILLLIYNRKRK